MADDVAFFVGQKAVIEKEGKVLILIDPILGADLPGGKIQVGETDFSKALQREVKEETAMDVTVGRPFYVWYYEFPENSPHRNRGKNVYCIAFVCTYVSGQLQLSDEHEQYDWVDEENFKEKLEGSNYLDVVTAYYTMKHVRDGKQ